VEKAKSAPRMEAFERALRRFVEGLAKPEDAIVRDACIQRFEFTFGACLKVGGSKVPDATLTH